VSHLDFDFSLLLVSSGLVYDEYSFHRLLECKDPSIKPLKSALRLLKSEGFLELGDFGRISKENEVLLGDIYREVMRDFTIWIPPLKKHLDSFDTLGPDLDRGMGRLFSEADRQPYPILMYLLQQFGEVDLQKAQELKQLVRTTHTRRRKRGENEILASLVRAPVEAVHLNMFLAEKFGCSLYNWHTLDGYYRILLLRAARDLFQDNESVRAAHNFFNLAFPAFQPKTHDEWLRLLRHPRIEELRIQVHHAVAAGRDIDHDFAEESLRGLLGARENVDRFKRFTGWTALLTSIAGGFAGEVFGGMLGGIAGGIVPPLAKEAADWYLERRSMKPYGWLYFTSNE